MFHLSLKFRRQLGDGGQTSNSTSEREWTHCYYKQSIERTLKGIERT